VKNFLPSEILIGLLQAEELSDTFRQRELGRSVELASESNRTPTCLLWRASSRREASGLDCQPAIGRELGGSGESDRLYWGDLDAARNCVSESGRLAEPSTVSVVPARTALMLKADVPPPAGTRSRFAA
jgi:hypothetical protein